MSAYEHALLVDETSRKSRLDLAERMLDRCEGVVKLGNVLALRSTPDAILCEVIDSTTAGHRCAEEFKVLIENAARYLDESKLASHLPPRPVQWRVVADDGTDAVELWPGTRP
ncbi:MAG: hypothetical protein R3F24_09600 [Gammaproteobacteria bacterium]